VILLITLVPFRFVRPPALAYTWTGGWRDTLANVALFFPAGFLYRFWRLAGTGPLFEVIFLALLVSAGIEAVQLYEPGRVASALDVVTNVLGAGLGALTYDAIAAGRLPGANLIRRTALELPLMGLVYLLLPLLWLESLTATASGESVWLAALLGFIGAGVIATLQRQLFSRGVFRTRETGLLAAAWFAIGAYPLLWSRPRFSLSCLVLVALIVIVFGAGTPRPEPKRFEIPVVRWVIPLFLIYLLLLAITPAVATTGTWTIRLGLGRSVAGAGTVATLRLIEYVAAFTLLGYMIAEIGSRLEGDFRHTATRIVLMVAPIAVLFEVVRGFHPDHGASISLLFGAVTGSLYGGMVYHLARAHARESRRATIYAPPAPLSRQQVQQDS
jgi:VanZ family protein